MNWIKNIGTAITTAITAARKPVQKGIPALLLLCEIQNRPGLSAMVLASSIIARLQENGFQTGKNPDGTENMNNKFVKILCKELVKEIKDNATVQSTIPVGSIMFTGTGGNAGGPVQVVGYNNMMATIQGLIQ